MKIKFKVWIEEDDKFLIGKGGYTILKAIDQYGSIAKASEVLNMSYKFIWSYIKKLEENLGESVVDMKRGKKGGTILTPAGKKLLRTYELVECVVRSSILELLNYCPAISCCDEQITKEKNMNSLITGCI